MEIINYIKNTTNLFFGKFDEGYKYLEENTKFLPVFLFGMLLYLLTLFIKVLYLIKTDVSFISTYNTIGNMFYLLMIISGLIQFLFISFGLIGFLYLFLKIFKGEEKYLETIKLIIAASTFTLLISLVFAVIPPKIINFNIFISAILMFIILGITIWNLYVNIVVLSKLHKISKMRVVYSMLSVFTILLLIIVGFGFYLSTLMING